jgi:hypothetical protein
MLSAKLSSAWLEVVQDSDPDASYLLQAGCGFEDRREQYERGEFGFIGLRACAEIEFTDLGGHGSPHTSTGTVIRTPGLWGIEDDSGEDYLRDVGDDEAHQLADMLHALNVAVSEATLRDKIRSAAVVQST